MPSVCIERNSLKGSKAGPRELKMSQFQAGHNESTQMFLTGLYETDSNVLATIYFFSWEKNTIAIECDM